MSNNLIKELIDLLQEKLMKTISFTAVKGGVGKTTLTYNFGEWLAAEGFQVLMIDNDPQSSLSQTYELYESEETVADIYRQNGVEPKIHKMKKGLDILPSTLGLERVNEELQTVSQKDFQLISWYNEHFDNVISQYDFILIDNHPDFSTITKNAVLVSDYIISPVEPGEYSWISKSNMESRFNHFIETCIDPLTRESYVTGTLKFVGNRVKHNTKTSREFLEAIAQSDQFLGWFAEKELFNKSTTEHISIVEMMNRKEYRRHGDFFADTNRLFQIILSEAAKSHLGDD